MPSEVKKGSAGFQPVSSFQTARRRLPHWQQGNSVYFISWVCRPGKTMNPVEKGITLEAIRFWDSRKWTVYAAVVMPDHVHLLAQPLPGPDGKFINLGEVIHSVKSFSAQKINRSQRSPGCFMAGGALRSHRAGRSGIPGKMAVYPE